MKRMPFREAERCRVTERYGDADGDWSVFNAEAVADLSTVNTVVARNPSREMNGWIGRVKDSGIKKERLDQQEQSRARKE